VNQKWSFSAGWSNADFQSGHTFRIEWAFY
jgi:hypothetical protein